MMMMRANGTQEFRHFDFETWNMEHGTGSVPTMVLRPESSYAGIPQLTTPNIRRSIQPPDNETANVSKDGVVKFGKDDREQVCNTVAWLYITTGRITGGQGMGSGKYKR